MSFSVTLLGATGLVGRHFLTLALADASFERIVTLSRRPISLNQPMNADKLESRVCELSSMDSQTDAFASSILVCCLGTTIKAAGSKSAFRQVDFDYVVQAATLAKQQGAKKMLVVSAVGADPQSPFFYNRVKGEMEQALIALQFESLSIIRPSLLLGKRQASRPLEDISKPLSRVLSPLLTGSMKRYRPIQGQQVAEKLIEHCKLAATGCSIVHPSM